jgi:outer membrane protein assembly complex protein YaeT
VTNPETTALLEEYYRQQGRLTAKVAEPKFEYDEIKRSARIVFAVEEGPAFRVGEITIEGNKAFTRDRLLETAFIQKGAEYSKAWMDTWQSRMEELYWTNGYNEVQIEYAFQERDNATIDLHFRLQEGLQGVVETVTVEGAHDTAEKMAHRQVKLAGGDVLDYRKTIESRRNLYQVGAYSMVDVEPQRLTEDELNGKVPIRMRVKLRERKPFSVRYGVSYDTERGPGFISDMSLRNKLGAARVLGGRVRYDSEFREARGYLTQPLMFGRHLNTMAAGYRSREIFETFITDRVGFSIQQQTRPWKGNIFTYGYRFERTDTFDKDPDSIFQVPPFNVAPLQFTWNRETRDEYLNATKGAFVSSGVEYAPSHLGSDVQFVKYVGQLFKYFPLRKPVEVPFGGPPRSRWVYAVAVRAGLGAGLGEQELIRSERFFAGGSTTLRGFDRDSVGPQDFFGPTGGDATFITNQEIRFPIYRLIEGVGFLDMGNVYQRVSDFNPMDLRYSSGFGIRLRTPFVLLRFDYGFILDRQPGEPVGGFYFSIGQAF